MVLRGGGYDPSLGYIEFSRCTLMIDALKFLLGVFCFWGLAIAQGTRGALLGSRKLLEAVSR